MWVEAWWATLAGFSALNFVLWRWSVRSPLAAQRRLEARLCLILIAGCAFRSFLPRADVQRICFVDSWLSCVAVGRSVATVAELCLVAQWALYLRDVGRAARSRFTTTVSALLMPSIAVAEVASWYAVLSTNYIGNVIEQSIWTSIAVICLAGLLAALPGSAGRLRRVAVIGSVGCAAYVAFMLSIDIPMYLGRLHADTVAGKAYLAVPEGFRDAAGRWVVTRDLADWRDEMAWMFFYFTAAVWFNIGLLRAPTFTDAAAPSHDEHLNNTVER